MRRSAPSSITDPLLFTVHEKERGREQFASLRTEVAMSGKLAAILMAPGWGSKVILEVKNVCSASGRGGGNFTKSSPETTATEEPKKEGMACQPFLPLTGG